MERSRQLPATSPLTIPSSSSSAAEGNNAVPAAAATADEIQDIVENGKWKSSGSVRGLYVGKGIGHTFGGGRNTFRGETVLAWKQRVAGAFIASSRDKEQDWRTGYRKRTGADSGGSGGGSRAVAAAATGASGGGGGSSGGGGGNGSADADVEVEAAIAEVLDSCLFAKVGSQKWGIVSSHRNRKLHVRGGWVTCTRPISKYSQTDL